MGLGGPQGERKLVEGKKVRDILCYFAPHHVLYYTKKKGGDQKEKPSGQEHVRRKKNRNPFVTHGTACRGSLTNLR